MGKIKVSNVKGEVRVSELDSLSRKRIIHIWAIQDELLVQEFHVDIDEDIGLLIHDREWWVDNPVFGDDRAMLTIRQLWPAGFLDK